MRLELTQKQLKSIRRRFWQYVDKSNEEGCWLWLGSLNAKGYGRFRISADHVETASHVSWFLHTGEWPKLFICHTCDVPACVNPSHLWEGTNRQNVRDSIAKGRRPHSSRGVLTWEQARWIRNEYATTSRTQKDIAKELGVAQTTVQAVLAQTSWRE